MKISENIMLPNMKPRTTGMRPLNMANILQDMLTKLAKVHTTEGESTAYLLKMTTDTRSEIQKILGAIRAKYSQPYQDEMICEQAPDLEGP